MKLLRHPPKYTYRGLTIVLANPSRFDKQQLLDGNGGLFFVSECLAPEMNRHQCDVRLAEDLSPLLPGTKCVLLLGDGAHKKWTKLDTTLDEQRGSPVIVDGIPHICSYTPQDAVDPVNHEARHNPLLNGQADHDEDYDGGEEGEGGDVYESKGRGRTKRSNYGYWLRNDTKKAMRICDTDKDLCAPTREQYSIYPSCDEVCRVLENTRGEFFNFDIETDIETMDMRCFAFLFSGNPNHIYVVPTLTINYMPAYGMDTARIYRALFLALQNNVTVAHNGATFDFPVLAYKYNLPVGKAYDTMIAQHRIAPKAEKSLGHCISLYTYLPYHKNEGIHTYMTDSQAEQLWKYCGKDVWGMHLVKVAMDALPDAGLQASIALAQRAILPYLTMSLTGMKYNEEKRKEWITESDLLAEQYMRVMRVLTGPNVPPLISNQKCVKYFHDMLRYPVISRTKSNNASLGADNLLKLKQKVSNNPVIDFLIRYREKQKEVGVLNFKPWRV